MTPRRLPRWTNTSYKREAENMKVKLNKLSCEVKLKETEIAAQKDEIDRLRKTISQQEDQCNELKEKICQGDQANKKNVKYLTKFKSYVEKVNDQNEKYLTETVAIRELVKTKFGAEIVSCKDGKLRLRMKENSQESHPQHSTLSDILYCP